MKMGNKIISMNAVALVHRIDQEKDIEQLRKLSIQLIENIFNGRVSVVLDEKNNNFVG